MNNASIPAQVPISSSEQLNNLGMGLCDMLECLEGTYLGLTGRDHPRYVEFKSSLEMVKSGDLPNIQDSLVKAGKYQELCYTIAREISRELLG